MVLQQTDQGICYLLLCHQLPSIYCLLAGGQGDGVLLYAACTHVSIQSHFAGGPEKVHAQGNSVPGNSVPEIDAGILNLA
jgi:hypothetical protein